MQLLRSSSMLLTELRCQLQIHGHVVEFGSAGSWPELFHQGGSVYFLGTVSHTSAWSVTSRFTPMCTRAHSTCEGGCLI